ncbi:uncharacterized protein TNCV_4197871 [Trichonephila clavipes]|nr:uncharacterized protein TNCV_4197871 [Trichonephila clavipes]
MVPSWHGGTLNSHRARSPLLRLVKGEKWWEALDNPILLPQNCGESELNRSVTCMVLKATTNGMHHFALYHDEYREPRSGLCRSGGISNNNSVKV